MQQLIVKSLTGQHYTAQAIIDRNRRINGERDITLSFLFNEINSEFIKDIETGWKLNFQGDWYHLFNEKTDVNGNKSFSGVLDFYHYMNGFWHMDEVENKSMTVQDAMMPLFNDKEYVLQIIDSFTANTMSYSKQQNSTERFSYFVDRFNAEYNIPIGTKTVQLRNKIGVTRNDVIIHEDDNLEDLSIDIDSSSFCTAINGYYDFQKPKDTKDGEELVPTKEFPYISPMAEKYGVIWGEPIHDERFSNLDAIKAACKEKQENSYKISYTIKKSLLGNALNEGDYVRFVAPSYNINTYVRVVEIKEQFDDDLDLIDEEYTFGNENIATAFSKMQYEAIRDVSDIMKGKKPIPYSVLPKAVREATNVINAGSTTQFYYREDGIYGYNTTNPLGVTRYNANGIGFSQNGGQTFQTAMTYLGIVANSITTGELVGLNITSPSEKSYFHVNGGDAEFVDRESGRKVSISPYGIFGYNEGGKVLFRADNTLVTSSALGSSVSNVYLGCAPGAEGRVVNINGIPGDGEINSYAYRPLRALAFKFPLNANGYIGIDGDELRIMSDGLVEGGYKGVRASGYIGNHLDVNTWDNGTHLYLRPTADGRVKATQRGTTDKFVDFQAAKIYGEVVSSSSEKLKTNIREWDFNGIEAVKAMKLYEYNYKEKLKNGDDTLNHGPIIEREIPEHIKDDEGVNIYEYVSTLTKAVQELISENEAIKKELAELKNK